MRILHDIALSRRPMAALVAVGISWGSFAGMVPAVKAQIGAGDALYGGLMLVASIGAILTMWAVPALHAVTGRTGRWAICIGVILIGLGFSVVGMSESAVVFVAALLLAAVGSAIADVLANAELAECEARKGRALMNLNHGMYSFAFAAGAILVAFARAAGWSPWAALGLAGAVCVSFCAVMWAPRSVAPPELPDENVAILPKLLVGLGGVVVLAAFLSEAATEGWSALHLERTLGSAAGLGALGPAIFGITMGVGRLFGHALAHRFSDLLLMTAACLVAALGLALAGAAPSVAVAYAGFAMAGLGISIVAPLALGLVGRSVPERVRLQAIARASALGYAAYFLGPPLMGGLSEMFGLRTSFGVNAAFLVAVAALIIPAFARQVALSRR